MNRATPHTPERLAQIASRKLSAMGIAHALSADARAAEGTLKFTAGRLNNPVSGAPVVRARFVTVGHDRLRFVDPPLAALGTFALPDTPAELETAVAVSLLSRAAGLEKARVRMTELRLEVSLDPDALVVRAPLSSMDCAFDLEASSAEVRVRRVRDRSGAIEIGEAYPPLDLEEFPSKVDLELHLSDALPRLRAAAAQPNATPGPAQPAAPSLVLETMPPPRGATTLGQLAAKFGPEAYLIPGEQIEVVQSFTAAGAHYRFSAVHDAGATFKVKITGPTGVVWQDRVDIRRFPGAAQMVSSAVAVPLAGADASSAAAEAAPAPPPPAPTPANVPAWAVPPHPGEIWVMQATVEARSDDQVRYVCVDPDGRATGAAQSLPRADFDRLFVAHGHGFRLRVEIAELEGDSVVYRQVDAAGRRSPTPRALPLATLMSTFVPEATAY